MRQGYSSTQIALHWIVVLLVAAQFLFADGIGQAWDAIGQGRGATFGPLVAMHVADGVAILMLVLWRLVLRIGRGVPAPPDSGGPLLRRAAEVTHWLFYALLIGLPLGGMAAWFGGIKVAAEVHAALTSVLLVVIGLHVAGALWHHFGLKDGLLARMMHPEG